MSWKVALTKRAEKQLVAVPEPVQLRLWLLVQELGDMGPVRGNWKNYGKLSGTRHHCHLKAGHPTYVACWEVVGAEVRIVEIYYVGTHEKAPY